MNQFTGVVMRKFGELVSVKREHSRKTLREYQMLKSKLSSLITANKEPVIAYEHAENNGEPIWVDVLDLMTLNASFDPSAFGRTLATNFFGPGKKCTLITARIGSKKLKPHSRQNVDQKLEKKMKECIERKFPNNKMFAVTKTFQGANQNYKSMGL